MALQLEPVVALERRLRHCRHVVCLGVKPNFSDYSDHDRHLIRSVQKIYYPSAFYAHLFEVMGKPTFPSHHSYLCSQDKIRQTSLFQMLGIAHPRTRFYYGRRQKYKILNDFSLPFIGKVAKGSALGRGVYLIRSPKALSRYCQLGHTAYIQEYLPIDRDIRVVVIGQKAVLAYWRIAAPGEYRSNVAMGGRIDFSNVPREAVNLAEHTARTCRWDDVGIDVCKHGDDYVVLEANMKYGLEGFRQAGIDYYQMMDRLIEQGRL